MKIKETELKNSKNQNHAPVYKNPFFFW